MSDRAQMGPTPIWPTVIITAGVCAAVVWANSAEAGFAYPRLAAVVGFVGYIATFIGLGRGLSFLVGRVRAEVEHGDD
jgi:hypothetical protein